jgi:hypothetical protein
MLIVGYVFCIPFFLADGPQVGPLIGSTHISM